jgi:hypothetical protein
VDAPSDLEEDDVAGGVSQGIVDLLEVVEVQGQEHHV